MCQIWHIGQVKVNNVITNDSSWKYFWSVKNGASANTFGI